MTAREEELKEVLRDLLYLLELEDAPIPLPQDWARQLREARNQAILVLGDEPIAEADR